jgi:tRNA dimethylallyltransferase
LVGGTPLYLKALLRGLFDGPPADPALRRRLTTEAEQSGSQVLHERLVSHDPATAQRVHPNDLRRIIRALEVWETTGRPMSAWQQQWAATAVSQGEGGLHRVLCLDLPRSELYERIEARVGQMIASGLVDEAASLRRLPQPLSREAAQAVGYKELFAYLDGQATLEQTIERIQIRSRNLAKRQLTWFRHLPECHSVTPQLTFAAWGLTMDQ